MDTNGFYGDTFSSGFGDFYTAKKRGPSEVSEVLAARYNGETPFSQADKFYSAQPGLSAWGDARLKVGTVQFNLQRTPTPSHPLKNKENNLWRPSYR